MEESGMAENRKTRMTKAVFKATLLDLLDKYPLNKITVSLICQEADMNRSTFYAHYEDQYELLGEIKNDFKFLIDKVVIDDGDDVFEQCRDYLKYIYDNKNAFLKLVINDHEFRLQLINSAFNFYKNRQDFSSSQIDPHELDARLNFVSAGSLSLVVKWLRSPAPVSSEQLIAWIVQFKKGIMLG